jgi:hypothetical protein
MPRSMFTSRAVLIIVLRQKHVVSLSASFIAAQSIVQAAACAAAAHGAASRKSASHVGACASRDALPACG